MEYIQPTAASFFSGIDLITALACFFYWKLNIKEHTVFGVLGLFNLTSATWGFTSMALIKIVPTLAPYRGYFDGIIATLILVCLAFYFILSLKPISRKVFISLHILVWGSLTFSYIYLIPSLLGLNTPFIFRNIGRVFGFLFLLYLPTLSLVTLIRRKGLTYNQILVLWGTVLYSVSQFIISALYRSNVIDGFGQLFPINFPSFFISTLFFFSLIIELYRYIKLIEEKVREEAPHIIVELKEEGLKQF